MLNVINKLLILKKCTKMNLDKLNLQELSKEEMVSVTGGSWIGRVWNWIKNHLGLSSNDIPAKEGGYTYSTHVTASWEF